MSAPIGCTRMSDTGPGAVVCNRINFSPPLKSSHLCLCLSCIGPFRFATWIGRLHLEVPLRVWLGVEDDVVLSIGQILVAGIALCGVLDDVPEPVAAPLVLGQGSPLQTNLRGTDWRDLQQLHGWQIMQCRVKNEQTCKLEGALFGGLQLDCVCRLMTGEVKAVPRLGSLATTRTWYD